MAHGRWACLAVLALTAAVGGAPRPFLSSADLDDNLVTEQKQRKSHVCVDDHQLQWNCYHSRQQVERLFDRLRREQPDRVHVYSIGKSVQGGSILRELSVFCN